MSDSDRELFERRANAITGYLGREPLGDLNKKWQISPWEIRRLRDRCLEAHPDGRLWGFRALVPRIRIRSYQRIAFPKPRERTRLAGQVGLLSRLFVLHPSIQEGVYSLFLKARKGANEPRIPLKSLHKRFIELCREAGVKENEFPFNTVYLAKRSLGAHMKALLNSDLKKAVLARFGENAARGLMVGTGVRAPHLVTLPLQRVQFDGHKIDAIFMIRIPLPGGGYQEVVLPRLWLLVVQDVATRAILGYHLSLNIEYTKDDIMRCIRNAIEPRPPVQLTIPKLGAHKNGGIPASVIPELAWAVWAELMYDNGKANLSSWVRTQVAHVLNCAVNAGPVRSPERRGIIEALFRVLEEGNFHRLPNTTGSNPQDTRRSDPEKAALEFRITLDHLLELLFVIVSNYNGAPHPELTWRSPLEMLRFFLDEEKVAIRRLLPEQRVQTGMLDMTTTRTVRGNAAKGRRPYIQFEDERYTSQVLARMPELIGTELTIIADTEDLRTIKAFLPDGAELGILDATGKWSHTPHSLATRRAGNRRRAKAVQHYADSENVDAVHVLLDQLSEEALRDKRAGGKHESVRREAGLPEDYREKTPAPKPVKLPPPPKRAAPTGGRQAIVY